MCKYLVIKHIIFTSLFIAIFSATTLSEGEVGIEKTQTESAFVGTTNAMQQQPSLTVVNAPPQETTVSPQAATTAAVTVTPPLSEQTGAVPSTTTPPITMSQTSPTIQQATPEELKHAEEAIIRQKELVAKEEAHQEMVKKELNLPAEERRKKLLDYTDKILEYVQKGYTGYVSPSRTNVTFYLKKNDMAKAIESVNGIEGQAVPRIQKAIAQFDALKQEGVPQEVIEKISTAVDDLLSKTKNNIDECRQEIAAVATKKAEDNQSVLPPSTDQTGTIMAPTT